MSPTPLRFGLPGGIKALRVEREDQYTVPVPIHCWRLWLSANADYTLGTFIQLNDDGTIQRVTWLADGSESIFDIKT